MVGIWISRKTAQDKRADAKRAAFLSSRAATPAVDGPTTSQHPTLEELTFLLGTQGLNDADWTLHAVGIGSYIGKYGRRTIPPAAIFAASGFGTAEAGTRQTDGKHTTVYTEPGAKSRIAPASSAWQRVQAVRFNGAQRNAKAVHKFWSGGFAESSGDENGDASWWTTLAVSWEEERVARMRKLRLEA